MPQSAESAPQKVSVMFVCLGNICRSTMAEGVFQHLVENDSEANVDKISSSGTSDYHVDETPDRRTMRTLRKFGITNYEHLGQQLEPSHFSEFDLILGMDEMNLRDIRDVAASASRASQRTGSDRPLAHFGMLGDYSETGKPEAIADPYYNHNAFEPVYHQVHRLCENLIAALKDGSWMAQVSAAEDAGKRSSARRFY